MSVQEFSQAVRAITAKIKDVPVDPGMAKTLDAMFPPAGTEFRTLAGLCRKGVKEGWLADREAGGIRYGRVIKAGDDTHGFSVDVVEMNDIVGPHHAHPKGEIDMVIPVEGDAKFDGKGEGWVVYGPGSRHSPTVRGGKAIVLYLLPGGEIDFKAQP